MPKECEICGSLSQGNLQQQACCDSGAFNHSTNERHQFNEQPQAYNGQMHVKGTLRSESVTLPDNLDSQFTCDSLLVMFKSVWQAHMTDVVACQDAL